MFYEVIPTILFRTDSATLTYSCAEKLSPGSLVKIPVGKKFCFGIVTKSVKKPPFATKSAEPLSLPPLPPHILRSIFWLSKYYLTPLPVVAKLFLPNNLKKLDKIPEEKPKKLDKIPEIPLSPAQKRALEELNTIKTNTRLLRGVTGSGKTNIYLSLTESTLKNQKSVILLVPEISLTSQLVSVFSQYFGEKVVLLHSALTDAKRRDIWLELLNTSDSKIVIGPRSALLSPLKNLGLILIDESHEPAYFQENPPRYSALRLASFIATDLDIPCVEGSATPLVADYSLARQKSALVGLTKKAKDNVVPPKISLIPLTSRENFTKNRYFSDPLLSAIKNNLENGHQTLIYHNRRGSAPLTLCAKCGWQALCPTCFLPLTLHTDAFKLICHTCGYETALPLSCPSCGHPDVLHKGFGTKLLESELKKLFKSAKISRFDADNKKSESLAENYDAVRSGDIDILIGTQTLARGLDLPHLATVAVVSADSGLSLPDFSAEERTFALLSQVIGRVGRGHLKDTNVFIQSYRPDHPVITAAIQDDYPTFAEYLLKKRRASLLPPYSYLARIYATQKTEATAIKKITTARNALKSKDLLVSAPTPAFHERTSSGYTWQLVVKSKNRAPLLSALSSLDPKLGLHFTLDPPSLL